MKRCRKMELMDMVLDKKKLRILHLQESRTRQKKQYIKSLGKKKGWRKGGIIRENNALGAKRTESFKKKELSMYANIVEKLDKRARRNLVQSFNPRARGDWGREGM